MLEHLTSEDFFHIYYKEWISVYKEGAIRDVTMAKYTMTLKWLERLAPISELSNVNRITYQQLLND